MPEGNGTQRDIGRIEGRLGAMEGDISEIKSTMKTINSYINQQKGEKRVVAMVAGSVSAFAAGIATYFVKGNT